MFQHILNRNIEEVDIQEEDVEPNDNISCLSQVALAGNPHTLLLGH